MKFIYITILISMVSLGTEAQTDTTSLLAHVDKVTQNWDKISEELEDYQGLKQYCLSKEFNQEVIVTLNSIHHYDTVIYRTLFKKNRNKKNKEIEHALHDIKKFEKKYTPQNLLSFLKEECSYRWKIEKEKKDTKSDFGAESYDGQITLLEAELYKYVKHITKLVHHIQKHSHHLHLEKYADE